MKTKKLRTIAQLLIIVGIVTFAACNKKNKTEYFKITVDEVTFEGVTLDGFRNIPAAIHVGDSIVLRLHGKIGPNQCYVFKDNDVVLSFGSNDAKKIIVDARGKQIDDGICDKKQGEAILDYELIIVIEEKDGPGVYTFYNENDPNTKVGEIIVK